METYSVSFRLQRTTTEYAYVSVPVTSDLVVEQADGTGQLNVDEMIERAIQLGRVPEVHWFPENQSMQAHPTQKAPEPDER